MELIAFIDTIQFIFLVFQILRHGLETIYKVLEKEEDGFICTVSIWGRSIEVIWATIEFYRLFNRGNAHHVILRNEDTL